MSEILTKAGIDGQSFCWKLFQNLRSGFSGKAQTDEKTQHKWAYVSILKKPATPPMGLRWGFEMASIENYRPGCHEMASTDDEPLKAKAGNIALKYLKKLLLPAVTGNGVNE